MLTHGGGNTRLEAITNVDYEVETIRESESIYIIGMGKGRYLLYINAIAGKQIRYEGIVINANDYRKIIPTLKIKYLSVYKDNNVSSIVGEKGFDKAAQRENGYIDAKKRPFAEALKEYRKSNYETAKAIALRLSEENPDFKWYRVLVNECLRKMRL